jgi:hypothetical protein
MALAKSGKPSARLKRWSDTEDEMERRAFCAIGGRAGIFTLAAGATRLDRLLAQEESEDPFEQRLAGVIQTYDAQGNHRTGRP